MAGRWLDHQRAYFPGHKQLGSDKVLISSCCHNPSSITFGLYCSSAVSEILCRFAAGLSCCQRPTASLFGAGSQHGPFRSWWALAKRHHSIDNQILEVCLEPTRLIQQPNLVPYLDSIHGLLSNSLSNKMPSLWPRALKVRVECISHDAILSSKTPQTGCSQLS